MPESIAGPRKPKDMAAELAGWNARLADQPRDACPVKGDEGAWWRIGWDWADAKKRREAAGMEEV